MDNIDNILSVLKEPKLKLVIQEYILYTIIVLVNIYYWIFLFLTTERFEQVYCYTSDNQFDICKEDDICDDLNIVLYNHTFNYHNHQLNSFHKVLIEESKIINTYYIGAGGIIVSLIFGFLSDIYGRRTIIRITLFIIAFSTIGIFIISFFLDCYYNYILNNFNTQYIINKEDPSYNNILSHLFAQNKVKEKFNKYFVFFCYLLFC